MDKTVYLNVAAVRREALAQSTLAPLPQQAFEGGKSWRARNEQLDPAVGLAAVQEDPEEGSDACCAKELLPASAGPQGRTCSLPLPQVHSSDVRCRQSENIGEAQAPRAAEGLSWRQKLLARLGTGHSSSHPDTPHRQRHFICDGSTAAIPESNSVSADHVLLKNASTSRLMHGGHDPHQHGSTIPGYSPCSPCAGGDGESHRHHRHYHHHHHHHQRHPHPHPHQQHYQQKYQQQRRQAQQHVPMAPAASRSSPVPAAAGAAAAAEPGAVSPRGGCHLVPLLSAADVQLAMQALQSAAWIHDYVWNSVDPATCGASPRTSSAGGGESGGGGSGDGDSSRSSTRRREALAAIATPVYREALAAVSRIQHPALHSLVDQAVAFYVDPALGEPEDVLRIILELLTACGGMPAAASPPPPSARAAAPAPQSRSLSGGGGGGSGKDRPGPAVAAAGAAAVAAGRVSESGSSVVTVPSCRSLGGARRISSSCRASPLAAEAAPRSCTALGAGSRPRETCGPATGGAEGRAVSSASAVGEAAGGGIRGFGLRRKVAERFLSRSDGSSSSSSSSTTSEAALSMGSSLGSLGVCTASGGGAAMAAAALHSCGSGVALHSASEGAPPGTDSGNDNLQSDLVITDASYTASAPTSAVIPAAAGAASHTSAAGPTCVPAGGNADGSGHSSSSRRAASLQGSEHITIPSGSSGGGNGGGACASGGAARALRTLSLHGLRDVFRSHHNSPAREARENSSIGSGSRSEVRGFPARAAMASDGSGGKGPASDHHHHHYHRLLSLFKKSGTAAH